MKIRELLNGLLQALLFLLVITMGSFLRPFGVQSTLNRTMFSLRLFVWDGLILALALFILLVVLERWVKRPARASIVTIGALLCAAALSFLLKIGFLTHDT